MTFEAEAASDSDNRVLHLRSSLGKEFETVQCLESQKTDMETNQSKLDNEIERQKTLLEDVQAANSKIQENIQQYKIDLEEHNKNFESISKLLSTKVDIKNRMNILGIRY